MKKYLIIDRKQRIEIEGPFSYALTRFIDEINKAGDTCNIVYYEDYEDSTLSNKYTHVIVRGHSNLEQFAIKKEIYEKARELNVNILNNKTFAKLDFSSKMAQYEFFIKNGIPTPTTFYSATGYDKIPFPFPVIAKHLYGENDLREVPTLLGGTKGGQQKKIKKNIYLVKSQEDFQQEFLRDQDIANYFVQEFIDSGKDFRVFMKKDNYLCGWIREATDGFLTVSHGKYSLLEDPSSKMIEICEKVARALESDFIAIDIIEKDGQPLVLEVNLSPGFKAFETKIIGHDFNIAKEILESY